MEYDDYEDFKSTLENLPLTWYPALLIIIIELVIDKKIFNGKKGLMIVINRIIASKGYK